MKLAIGKVAPKYPITSHILASRKHIPSTCKLHLTSVLPFRGIVTQHGYSHRLAYDAFVSSTFLGLRTFSTHNNNEKQKDQQREHNNNGNTTLKSDNQHETGGNLSAKNRSVGLFLLAIILAFIGLTYASVPLYRLFCQTMGKCVRFCVDA